MVLLHRGDGGLAARGGQGVPRSEDPLVVQAAGVAGEVRDWRSTDPGWRCRTRTQRTCWRKVLGVCKAAWDHRSYDRIAAAAAGCGGVQGSAAAAGALHT